MQLFPSSLPLIRNASKYKIGYDFSDGRFCHSDLLELLLSYFDSQAILSFLYARSCCSRCCLHYWNFFHTQDAPSFPLQGLSGVFFLSVVLLSHLNFFRRVMSGKDFIFSKLNKCKISKFSK
jgi:hypothetical protein